MGNFAFFRAKEQIPLQTANSAALHENPHTVDYCWPSLSIPLLDDGQHQKTIKYVTTAWT